MENACCRSAAPRHGRRHSVTGPSCTICSPAMQRTHVATSSADPRGTTVTGAALRSGLDEVLDAARRLPVCDRAAKLHALIARLQDAVDQGATTAAVADALAVAAIDALVDDPWVQFEAAVRRFKDRG